MLILTTPTEIESPFAPSAICPWCDDPLPTNTSPKLLGLINDSRELSHPRPTRWNPFALYSPVATFTAVCHQHEQELDREIHPDAYDPTPAGWPEIINWKTIPDRVLSFRDYLQSIIDDVDRRWMYPSSCQLTTPLDEDLDQLLLHPRTHSYFWKAMTNDIILFGHKYVWGIDGQTATFERTQPG